MKTITAVFFAALSIAAVMFSVLVLPDLLKNRETPSYPKAMDIYAEVGDGEFLVKPISFADIYRLFMKGVPVPGFSRYVVGGVADRTADPVLIQLYSLYLQAENTTSGNMSFCKLLRDAAVKNTFLKKYLWMPSMDWLKREIYANGCRFLGEVFSRGKSLYFSMALIPMLAKIYASEKGLGDAPIWVLAYKDDSMGYLRVKFYAIPDKADELVKDYYRYIGSHRRVVAIFRGAMGTTWWYDVGFRPVEESGLPFVYVDAVLKAHDYRAADEVFKRLFGEHYKGFYTTTTVNGVPASFTNIDMEGLRMIGYVDGKIVASSVWGVVFDLPNRVGCMKDVVQKTLGTP